MNPENGTSAKRFRLETRWLWNLESAVPVSIGTSISDRDCVLKSYQGKGTFLINTQVENWDEAEYKITSEDCMDICKVLEFRKILEPGACVLAMENCDEKQLPLWKFIWNR